MNIDKLVDKLEVAFWRLRGKNLKFRREGDLAILPDVDFVPRAYLLTGPQFNDITSRT